MCLEFFFHGALITNLKVHIPNIHNQTLPRTVDLSYDPINQISSSEARLILIFCCFHASLQSSLTYFQPFGLIVQEEIEVEGKLLLAGKSIGVVSVDFRKKKTGKLMAQARHTKYLAVSSKL